MKEVRAVGRYLKFSAFKARPFVDSLRDKSVEQVLNIINVSGKKAARIVGKVFKSAIANAENLDDVNVEFLKVKQISVNEGPTLRRFRPRAMGRATRIRKRSCHVMVVLEEDAKKRELAELSAKAKAKKKEAKPTQRKSKTAGEKKATAKKKTK